MLVPVESARGCYCPKNCVVESAQAFKKDELTLLMRDGHEQR